MSRTTATLAAALDSPRAFAAIVASGLMLRVLCLVALAQFPLVSDALSYHEMAVKLLHGDRFDPYFPPGVPGYLAFVFRIFGESQIAARASMLPFYVALSWLIHRVVGRLSGRRAASLAVLIFTLYPAHVFNAITPLTQLPTATCLMAIVYLVLRLCDGGRGALAIPLGFFLAWLSLIRPSNLPFLGAVPVFLLVRTRRLLVVAGALALAALMIGGWLYRAHAMTGRFVMINDANSLNLFIANNPYTPLYRTWWFGSHGDESPGVPEGYRALSKRIQQSPPEVRDKLYSRVAIEHIRGRPDLFVVRTLNRLRAYFGFDTNTGSHLRAWARVPTSIALGVVILDAAFYWLVMVSALAFLFRGHRSSMRSVDLWFVLGTIVTYAIPYWLTLSHPTYHFPVIPLFAIFGCAYLARRLGESPRGVSVPPSPSGRGSSVGWRVAVAVFVWVQIEWIVVNWSRI